MSLPTMVSSLLFRDDELGSLFGVELGASTGALALPPWIQRSDNGGWYGYVELDPRGISQCSADLAEEDGRITTVTATLDLASAALERPVFGALRELLAARWGTPESLSPRQLRWTRPGQPVRAVTLAITSIRSAEVGDYYRVELQDAVAEAALEEAPPAPAKPAKPAKRSPAPRGTRSRATASRR